MTQQEAVLHKKRYGQYFSGKKVADLLFSFLPPKHEWLNVVDPMAGIGDMLVAVRDHLNKTPQLLAIEIDDAVAKQCNIRVPEARTVCCDAFKCDELITPEGFDLVITNPPYVRYQLQNENDDIMPSAHEIRKNLISFLGFIPYLDAKERDLFVKLAANYSGLADMAVPAWLLCAALVKKGGYLAVVVPETWLNRDYAAPIQYLLQKCFQIETVAINTNADWFSDALVKTCLVVAKRIDIQSLIESKSSLTKVVETDQVYTQLTSSLFPQLQSTKEAEKWLMSEDRKFFSNKPEIPHELSKIIGDKDSTEFVLLSEVGINCGQGLRTGANEFFYVETEKDLGDMVLVHSKEWDHGGKTYCFNKNDTIPTLQNRGEIDGIVVNPKDLVTRVIYPQGVVRGDLLEYVSAAEKYQDARGRHFKDYSAVHPNEKKSGDTIIREWFRLPKMTERHAPNLCLTRVSAKIPECLYVQQSKTQQVVIDANMVTLWGDNTETVRIMMAILNSTWSKLSLELICTVMGGGALKVEASHLKKLLLPKMTNEQLKMLEEIGNTLIAGGYMTDAIQDKIDNIVASGFMDKKITQKMRELLIRKYNERSVR